MSRHKIVESTYSQHHAKVLQQKLNASEFYSEYGDKFVQIHLQSWLVWDGHFGRISISKLQNELFHKLHFIYLASHLANPTEREFQRLEIEKTISQKVIETKATEFVASINFRH